MQIQSNTLDSNRFSGWRLRAATWNLVSLFTRTHRTVRRMLLTTSRYGRFRPKSLLAGMRNSHPKSGQTEVELKLGWWNDA